MSTRFSQTETGEGLFEPLSQSLSVSEASALVRGQVEALGTVRVVGELSAPKLHSSGHFYADLKDETSTLAVVAWRSVAQYWQTVPQHGQLVEIKGRLTTYPARSSYQLQITSLQLAGQGALLLQLEALKAKLHAEGLFEGARKQAIPYLPARVGIITSPTGAVLHDILARIAARCPREVVFAPCAVQGAEAPAQIAAAIIAMNALPVHQRPEVLIIARGGGNLEDLMAFNSEAVVRAVAASDIPTISGVGHEPDVTLCDFAADHRAATPTAAAEAAVPVRANLLGYLSETQQRLDQIIQKNIAQKQQNVTMLQRMLPNPERLLTQANQSLGQLSERLQIVSRNILQQPSTRLAALQRVLAAHHPEAPLQRGYALLWRGTEVVSATSLAGPIEVQFASGRRKAMLEQ